MSGLVTWIIGASSGVGRATALELAGPERTLVLSGRRTAALTALHGEVLERSGRALVAPADISDSASVASALETVSAEVGAVDELVHCAGLNVKNRTWDDLDLAGFQAVLDTNLTSVARAVAGVLPGMRSAGRGRIVVVSSWAGWTFARGAGVAYSASKTALLSLTESVNDQESRHGISAGVVCPGDIDTEFIDQRPTVPDSEARSRMLGPPDVARGIGFVLRSPAAVCINELVISPVHSHSYGR